MDSTELRNLHEAYLDVYEQDEILDEAEVMKHQQERSAIERRKKMRGYEPPTKGVHGEIERRQAQKPPSKLRSGSLPESYDLFDAILEYLVAEGYADTNESALVIMANMSEEWRESIVEDDKSYDKNRKRAAARAEERNRLRQAGKLSGPMERISLRDKFGDAAGTRMAKAKPPGPGEKH